MNLSRVFARPTPWEYLCECTQIHRAIPWDRIQPWTSPYVLTFSTYVELSHRLGHSLTPRMRDRQGMLWSCSVSAWDWRITQLFSIVLPAAMYSHSDILESKVVWSSGKVKYPIILLSHWGDSETVIDTEKLLNERSQVILVAHFWVCFLFFPSALLTNGCQYLLTKSPTKVSNISGARGYHGLAENIRFR